MSGAVRATGGEPVGDLLSLRAPAADHETRLTDPKRLAALALTGLMDEEADTAFDRFTKLAARWIGAPVALVSLVDDHRQFFKSEVGLGEPWASQRQTPLSHSFCQYTVSSGEPLIVADARQHPWLHDNLAIDELQVVAYAGVPLMTAHAQALGALCVIDSEPRIWTEREIDVLRDLAAITMTEIELRGRLAHLHALRAERGKERALLHSVLGSMDDSIVVTGVDGETMLANPAARRSRGGESFELDGATPLAPSKRPFLRALAGEHVRDVAVMVRVPGQKPAYHSINASPLLDASGTIFAAVSVGRDVTAAHEAALALARSEAILQGVVRHLPNGAVLLFDQDLRYLMADGELLLGSIGLSRDALVGRTLYEVSSPMTVLISEQHYRDALAGKTSTFEMVRHDKTFALTTVPVRDARGDVTAGLAMVYDVTIHKRAEAQVRREAAENRSRALRDELTELYNRRGFLEVAGQQLSLAQRSGKPALLFFVDLNGMKLINDQLGHEQGDRALIETADVLRVCFRGSDVVARLGGDEFVALLPDGDATQLTQLTERVQRELESRNADPNRAFRLSASIGAAAFDPGNPEGIESLLAKADARMYEQKKSRQPPTPDPEFGAISGSGNISDRTRPTQ
jgi:diguanylate cyclase (GGDEF)-like protein